MVQAEPPEDRRRQIARRDRVARRVGSDAVAGTVDRPAPDAAAGEQGGEPVAVVVAVDE